MRQTKGLIMHLLRLEEGTPPNSFYNAIITTTPKPDKRYLKKENDTSVSLMITDAKILNTILAKQFTKSVIYCDHCRGARIGQHAQISQCATPD